MKIKSPENEGEVEVSIDGDKIAFVLVEHDSFTGNPLDEFDGMGKIYSLSNHHPNCDRQLIEGNLENPDAVRLAYFEHGLCRWGVSGTMSHTPDFRWDGVDFAGMWLPDKDILAEAKGLPYANRREMMEKRAAQACETYTQWCNGDVFFFRLLVYKLRFYENGEPIKSPDYYENGPFTPILDDSCGGFYGWEYAVEEVERSAESI